MRQLQEPKRSVECKILLVDEDADDLKLCRLVFEGQLTSRTIRPSREGWLPKAAGDAITRSPRLAGREFLVARKVGWHFRPKGISLTRRRNLNRVDRLVIKGEENQLQTIRHFELVKNVHEVLPEGLRADAKFLSALLTRVASEG